MSAVKNKKRVENTSSDVAMSKTLKTFLSERLTPEESRLVFKESCVHLFDNKYRINLWAKKENNTLCPNIYISHSFFVSLHEGLFVDHTIRKEPEKKNIFQ